MYGVGCFNLSIFLCFDIHSIFDLLSISIWDFVIWWFDIDFILFDFLFDFLICLTYLFLFLINFFISIFFSFLIFFINSSHNINLLNIGICVYLTFLYFSNFLFIFGLQKIIYAIDFFFLIYIFLFFDFTSFAIFSTLYVQDYVAIGGCYFNFILFYFVINVINYIVFFLIRCLFLISFDQGVIGDVCYSLNSVTHLCIQFLSIMIVNATLLHYNNQSGVLSFFYVVHLNYIIFFNLVYIFFLYSVLNFYFVKQSSVLLIIKYANQLYNLNVNTVINIYNFFFFEVYFILLFFFIIFITNFFGFFINDFLFLFITYCFTLLFFMFSFFKCWLNLNVYNHNNVQLTYLNNF